GEQADGGEDERQLRGGFLLEVAVDLVGGCGGRRRGSGRGDHPGGGVGVGVAAGGSRQRRGRRRGLAPQNRHQVGTHVLCALVPPGRILPEGTHHHRVELR